MKWTMAAVLCIAFTIRTSGQTQVQKQEVQKVVPVEITSDYYAQPKVLVLHALNNSGRDITGYMIVIRHKNADGTLNKGGWSGYTSDMLNVLITSQMAEDPAASERVRLENSGNKLFPAGTGIFVAGETRDMTLTGIESGSDVVVIAGAVSTLTVHTTNKIRMLSSRRSLTGRGRCSR